MTHNILRWHWQAPGLCTREGRPHLGLLDGPESWWLLEIRQGLRLAERKKAGTRRRDLRGIGSKAGIDRITTIKASNSTTIPPERKTTFVSSGLKDSLIATEQTHRCPCVVEDRMLWRCPRWKTLLCEKQAPRRQDRLAWPPRTSKCGIFFEDPEALVW